MKNAEKNKSGAVGKVPDDWSVSAFEELELAQRTQKPPAQELIVYLNHLVKKPPFCWTNKYKDHLPRL